MPGSGSVPLALATQRQGRLPGGSLLPTERTSLPDALHRQNECTCQDTQSSGPMTVYQEKPGVRMRQKGEVSTCQRKQTHSFKLSFNATPGDTG